MNPFLLWMNPRMEAAFNGNCLMLLYHPSKITGKPFETELLAMQIGG